MEFDKIILATGGISYPATGSTGGMDISLQRNLGTKSKN